jgi:SAM-dependent methyltransferase
MKDNFSHQADAYAQFRPHYPAELYAFLFDQITRFDSAWDVGTGNGQCAVALASKFRSVLATDISAKQISHAPLLPNIRYAVAAAENCPMPDASFDLITVGQALHWFDFESFFREVARSLRPEGFFAAFGYGLLRTNEAINAVLDQFYTQTVGPYWDAERRHVDAHYQTIPFPFEPVDCPGFRMRYTWSKSQFLGYLGSWSAVQHYLRHLGHDPLPAFAAQLAPIWPDDVLFAIDFPVFIIAGRTK